MIFWSACTVGLEVLGQFGAIATYPILALSGPVAAAGLIAWRIRGGEPDGKPGPDDSPAQPEATVSVAMVLAAALLYAIPSLVAAVKVVSDGPIYHLYFAARWWKAGRLVLVAAPFGENAATYFPANGDLWFTWLMASCGGDTLAKVGQAPFLLLAGVAAYGCARLLGIGRSASTIAACWFVTVTPLLLFSFEPNVDTIFVAGYLLAAYFFLRSMLGATAGCRRWHLGALAAGEALGTKPTAVVFVPPLLGAGRSPESCCGRVRSVAIDPALGRRDPAARHGRLLVHRDAWAHRQSALSAGCPRARPHDLAGLVRDPTRWRRAPITCHGASGGRWPTS